MSTKQEFIKKIAEIQLKLKAPKSQYNSFGKYNFRNQEDILEAVKPLLGEFVLTVSDEVVEVGGRVYIRATATITDGEHSLVNTALAREAEDQKGMSEPMLTGSSSSFARKYSLNGLFLIDDTKDVDTTHTFGKEEKPSTVTRKDKTKDEVKAAQEPNLEVNEPKEPQSQPEGDTRPAGGSFRRRGARG